MTVTCRLFSTRRDLRAGRWAELKWQNKDKFRCVWTAAPFTFLRFSARKVPLNIAICRTRFVFWRMKITAEATFVLFSWWRKLKSSLFFTRALSITYARIRIVDDKSQCVFFSHQNIDLFYSSEVIQPPPLSIAFLMGYSLVVSKGLGLSASAIFQRNEGRGFINFRRGCWRQWYWLILYWPNPWG